jgi:hypothetical protein
MTLCIAAITGATYEFVSDRKDARRFPQEGRSVDVGGFRLNIHCTGEGGPAVTLDSFPIRRYQSYATTSGLHNHPSNAAGRVGLRLPFAVLLVRLAF